MTHGTDRPSSSHEPTSPTGSGRAWPAPKSPLSPHRLAKLANALGISAPMPTSHAFLPMVSPPSFPASPALSQPPDFFRRSPTPSTASARSPSPYGPTTSKFLLHVIPPPKLPHDSDIDQPSEYTPPPPSASGYHTQFRRGIFVPLHSSLHNQLAAIAKEYALPSTTGLILYLVQSSSSSPRLLGSDENEHFEPGPRLSEEMWRHVWQRVLLAEQEEAIAARPRTLAPQSSRLASQFAARSTPHLTQDLNGLNRRPSTTSDASSSNPAPYPSPSTPSTPDVVEMKSTPPSSSPASIYEPSTPSTSLHSETRSNSLELPGLHSNSIIPILAKVEFDIDQKMAKWFDPWLRSRRLNQSKRMAIKRSDIDDTLDDDQQRPPLPLTLASAIQPKPLFESPLSPQPSTSPFPDDSVSSGSDSDYQEEDLDDVTTRVPSVVSDGKAGLMPTVTLESDEIESRPRLSLSIPETLPTPVPTGMSAQLMQKKNVPPPLVLPQRDSVPTEPDQGLRSSLPYLGSDKSSNSSPEPSLQVEEVAPELRSRLSARRTGVFYEGLDLGIEVAADELSEEEPGEETKDQYEFSTKLDAIERNLEQFSPRVFSEETGNEQLAALSELSLTEVPSGQSFEPLRNADVFPPTPDARRTTFSEGRPSIEDTLTKRTSPPRLAVNGVTASPPRSRTTPSLDRGSQARQLNGHFLPGPSGSSGSPSADSPIIPPSPGAPYPLLGPAAVIRGDGPGNENPVIPLSPDPFGRYPSTPASDEGRMPSVYWDSRSSVVSTEPSDIFTPSLAGTEATSTSSRFSTDSANELEAASAKRTTMLSVKVMKKLWRKSSKQSISEPIPVPPTPPPPTPSLSSSFMQSLPPPRQRAPSISHTTPPVPSRTPPLPEGLSRDRSASAVAYPQHTLDMPNNSRDRSSSVNNLPMTPTFGSFPSQAPPRPLRPSGEDMELPDIPSVPNSLNIPQYQGKSNAPIVVTRMQRTTKRVDRLHFDQESPYPNIQRTVPRQSPRQPTMPLPHSPMLSSTPPLPSVSPPMELQNGHPQRTPSPGAVSVTESQKTAVRKSILKWKSVTPSIGPSRTPTPVSSEGERRSSVSRSRRPSLSSFASSRHSPELPPTASPQLPSSALPQSSVSAEGRVSHLTTPSTDSFPIPTRKYSLGGASIARSVSPAQSVASSQYSGELGRPSIDSTQFEIVSPKIGNFL